MARFIAVFTGPGDEALVVNLQTGAFVFSDGNSLISTGTGARVQNGKLVIHEQDDQGRKIDVMGSTDGTIEVVIKPKGGQKKTTYDLALDLLAACSC